MPDPLVIAVAQPLCVAHDVTRNALTHAASVRSAGARVVVFPELSLTGYELDGYAPAAGRSGVWQPDGVAVARAGPEIGAVARATLSPISSSAQ